MSLDYLLRGTIEGGDGLYNPCKETYEMMKPAVVGGQSLVFTPYHEVGVTKIRSYQIADSNLCKQIIIITFTFFMLCGKDIVLHSRSPEAGRLIQQNVLKAGTWVRFAVVDTETP